MAGVLDGIKILDLSRGIAGPMATMLLSDHGAEVTRIESPHADPFRDQPGYHAWNRGKRSAVLDLKDDSDRAAFLALAKEADVIVESFALGTTRKLGIDFETLEAENPRLIYCSITGYGRDNLHSERPGYDALVAARSGLQWEQRGWVGGSAPRLAGKPPLFPDFEVDRKKQQGAPREGPLFPASRFPSLGAAYAATTAISAALRAREVTGRGQRVETSLLQGALAAGVLGFAKAENIEAENFMAWVGDSRAPKGLFECADGRWVHAWPPNPRFTLSAAAGDTLNATPDLTVREDPDRIGIGPEEIFVLDHYWEPMAEAYAKFSADAWTDAGATAEVCIQKIRSPEEALTDPLLEADRLIAELDDPELGKIRTVGVLYNLEHSPGEIKGPAPRIGEHTKAVKAEAAAISKDRGAAQTESQRGAEELVKGPLDGITVLDFGLAVAGPYGAQILSDLGANVIKINALHDWYWHSSQLAMACNRGKRSIAINLKHPEAMQAIHRLLASADVVLHNMRYRAAIKLGIDYESLKEKYPRLVYCHTRGFEHGPRESLPGNDQTGACLAGVEYEDGGCARGGRPMWSLTSMGDTGNGFLAAIAISQALFERERTGRGQFCETSIVGAQLYNSSHAIARPDGSAVERPLLDANQTGFSAGIRLYPTGESQTGEDQAGQGWLCLSLTEEKHWQALARVTQVDVGDPAERADNDAQLTSKLEALFASAPAAEWFGRLDAAGVPCEISSDRAGLDLWEDKRLIDQGLIAVFPHRVAGELGQPGLAFQFSQTPTRVQDGPMLVGEHTREILSEAGYDRAEIDALFEAGAVGDETVYPSLAKDGAAVAASPWDPK